MFGSRFTLKVFFDTRGYTRLSSLVLVEGKSDSKLEVSVRYFHTEGFDGSRRIDFLLRLA